jgi:hypothetical protein
MTTPESLRSLLEAIDDLGNDDIYTDADEYEYRVNAMGRLMALLRDYLSGKCITVDQVELAAHLPTCNICGETIEPEQITTEIDGDMIHMECEPTDEEDLARQAADLKGDCARDEGGE